MHSSKSLSLETNRPGTEREKGNFMKTSKGTIISSKEQASELGQLNTTSTKKNSPL